MAKKSGNTAQYSSIVVHIFRSHWTKGVEEFEFHRDELVQAAVNEGVERPDNLGDVIYTFKFRRELPAEILETAPKGKSWIIEGAGSSRYRFRLVKIGGNLAGACCLRGEQACDALCAARVSQRDERVWPALAAAAAEAPQDSPANR